MIFVKRTCGDIFSYASFVFNTVCKVKRPKKAQNVPAAHCFCALFHMQLKSFYSGRINIPFSFGGQNIQFLGSTFIFAAFTHDSKIAMRDSNCELV